MKKAGILFLAGIFVASALVISAVYSQDTFIAGRNVNMVSGTRLPHGDPWLQRQNEPSIAVSTRNPLHLLGGSNDYRTVDMPDAKKLPGIPPQVSARDAWAGVYKSLDGGQSWITTLLPGFPQDQSPEGLASPIKGFDAVCDPYVRASANGMFYFSGIAFMRGGGAGAVFVSRFIDNNNLERIEKEWQNDWQWIVKKDPIKYIDTRIVDLGNPGQFIDMASVAVDVPRPGNSGSQLIYGQDIPNANVYVAYTVFLGVSVNDNVRCRLMLVKSTDCGRTWGKPIKLSEGWHIIQRATIAVDPSDPTGNTVYVAFRRFAHGTTPSGIGIVKSYDGGNSFTKPIEVATLLHPFDQSMTTNRFRTNSYPTMAVDHAGVVHIAWAERRNPSSGDPDPNGQARIVFISSPGGLTWGTAQVVEQVHPEYIPTFGGPIYLDGHQIMPCLEYSGGKLMLTWYDQRGTIAKSKTPDCITAFIEDMPEFYRHTLDVRAAEWPLGTQSWFNESQQVSRYLFYLFEPPDELPSGDYIVMQGEHNVVNLPLFEIGTKPFHGDYMDLASSPNILPPPIGNGSWIYNISPGEPTNFVASWTDNRDVRPDIFFISPNDLWGGWAYFHPPNSEQGPGWEQTNPLTSCTFKDNTGNRNQNVYSASLSNGIIIGSPGNSKQLNIAPGQGGRRTFVVFIKNLTAVPRFFDLSFDTVISKVNASFDQVGEKDELSVAVGSHSSVSLTVYVDNTDDFNSFAPVKVDIQESTATGLASNGPLVGYVLLNPDPKNLTVEDPADPTMETGTEKHQPKVSNPKIWKFDLGNENEPHAGVVNPRVQNPRVQNSGHVNPRVQNPRVQNPRVQNNSVKNNNIVNQEVGNPRVQNPRVQNTALTDMTWTVTNDGNTTSAYTFDVIADTIGDLNVYFENGTLYGQVLVYKINTIPADAGCDLMVEHHDELLVNVTNPRVQNPRVQNVTPTATAYSSTANDDQDIGLNDVTFHLSPGDTAYVTLRVYDPDLTDGIDFEPQAVAGEVAAEAADTGEAAPKFEPQPDIPWETPLPMIVASPYSMSFGGDGTQDLYVSLTALPAGGSLPFEATSDAEWLSVTPTSGELSDTPLTLNVVVVDTEDLGDGSYVGSIAVIVPQAANNPLRIPVFLTTGSPSPEMEVFHEGEGPTPIPDGGTFEFGNPGIGSTLEETFSIANMGGAPLILGGKPIIRITGPDADQFSVLKQPTSPVAPDAETTFRIRFRPTSAGPKTAMISIFNSDFNENPYDIMFQGTASVTERLIAFYPFNGNANDESGNGNHGMVSGAVLVDDIFGDPYSAYEFDGVDDKITAPEIDFETNSLSVSLLVKIPDATEGTSYFVDSNGFGVWQSGSDVGLAIHLPSTNSAGGGLSTYDEWYHFVGTYDGTTIRAYINGSLVDETGYPGNPADLDRQLTLGHFAYSTPVTYWNGSLDEVRIYNYALTQAEVLDLNSTYMQALVDCDFDSDPVNQSPPESGPPSHPSDLTIPTGWSILVRLSSNEIATQPVEIHDPDGTKYGSVDYSITPVTSGRLRVEATVSIDRKVGAYFLQTSGELQGGGLSAVISRLWLTYDGRITGGGQNIGTYEANVPFRVRMYVDLDSQTWSAAVDDEMDGFGNDPIFTNLNFANHPNVALSIRNIHASFNNYLDNLATTIAYDDILVTR